MGELSDRQNGLHSQGCIFGSSPTVAVPDPTATAVCVHYHGIHNWSHFRNKSTIRQRTILYKHHHHPQSQKEIHHTSKQLCKNAEESIYWQGVIKGEGVSSLSVLHAFKWNQDSTSLPASLTCFCPTLTAENEFLSSIVQGTVNLVIPRRNYWRKHSLLWDTDSEHSSHLNIKETRISDILWNKYLLNTLRKRYSLFK